MRKKGEVRGRKWKRNREGKNKRESDREREREREVGDRVRNEVDTETTNIHVRGKKLQYKSQLIIFLFKFANT